MQLWLRRSVMCLPFLAAAVMVYGWPLAPDHDLYHHLQMGEILSRTKTFLFHDVFTYTAAGREDDSWLFWLSQIIFYQLHYHFGEIGLRALNLLLVWVTLFFVARFSWKKTRNVGITTATTCAALVIHHRIQILRPLLFGEALFAVITFGFLARGRKLTPREIFFCAVMAALWANLHATVVILVPLFLIHVLTQKQPAALLVPLATLFNPKGVGLYSAVWEANQAAKLTGNWEFASASPLVWIERYGFPPLLQVRLDAVSLTILILIPLVAWQIGKRRDVLLPFNLFCLAMPLLSVRHALYLFFPISYFLATWETARRYTGYVCVAGLSLLILFRVHQSGYVNLSVEKASDLVDEAGLQGNIFSEDGWGAYLSYRHYPQLKVASDLRTNLHRDFFKRVGELKHLYGPAAWKFIVDELPEETDMILAIAWKQQVRTFLSPEKWVVVFENNHATLALKRNARNAENFRRIETYYLNQGVPFTIEKGFIAQQVWERAPQWYQAHQDTVAWGRWPEPATFHRWKEKERLFYELPRPLG